MSSLLVSFVFPPHFNESKMYIACQIIGRRFRPLPAGRGAFSDGNGGKRFERNIFLCHYLTSSAMGGGVETGKGRCREYVEEEVDG